MPLVTTVSPLLKAGAAVSFQRYQHKVHASAENGNCACTYSRMLTSDVHLPQKQQPLALGSVHVHSVPVQLAQ